MTIIQPNRSSRGINLVFTASILALLATASWSIVLYNGTVNIAHDISAKEREYKTLLAKNAELKNTFYALTDTNNLRRAAESAGLRAIARPEYVEESHSPTLAAR